MKTRELLLATLEKVAWELGPDCAGVVFVGGTVAALYEDATLDVRPTDDVDVVTAVALPQYYALLERLKAKGFGPCLDEDAPVCRLVTSSGLKVDVMPVDPAVLGFSNRWYPEAFARAGAYRLPGGTQVKAITPPYFLATKLEAFRGRGNGDFRSSHDLEDLVSLLGRMPQLLEELRSSGEPVAEWLVAELRALAGKRAFLEAVEGCFPGDAASQQVAAALLESLEALRTSATGRRARRRR